MYDGDTKSAVLGRLAVTVVTCDTHIHTYMHKCVSRVTIVYSMCVWECVHQPIFEVLFSIRSCFQYYVWYLCGLCWSDTGSEVHVCAVLEVKIDPHRYCISLSNCLWRFRFKHIWIEHSKKIMKCVCTRYVCVCMCACVCVYITCIWIRVWCAFPSIWRVYAPSCPNNWVIVVFSGCI